MSLSIGIRVSDVEKERTVGRSVALWNYGLEESATYYP